MKTTQNKILLFVLLIVTITSLVGVSRLVYLGYLGKSSELELKALVSNREFALSDQSLEQADASSEVQLIVQLSDQSFSAVKVVDGVMNGGRFSKETVVIMPNGDYRSINNAEGTVLEKISLRDGSVTTGTLLEYPILFIRLSDGETRAIVITNGEVVRGRLTGTFSAIDVESGVTFAASLTGKYISRGYISDYKPYVPSVIPLVTEYLRSRISYLPSSSVLAATTSSDDLSQQIVVDYEKDTFKLPGVNIAQNIDIALLQTLVRNEGLKIEERLSSNASSTTVTTSYTLGANSVGSLEIINDSIKNQDIFNDAINSEKIENNTVSSDDIKDGTIKSSDLSSDITFGAGDIESVTAGNGLTGGATSGDATLALLLTTSGTTGSTSSNSGLEVGSGGLTLLKGCSDNEVLKYTDAGGWACATDASGSGSATIQEGDTTVVATASTFDFLGADFTITESPSGEANISIDYANSGILTASNYSSTLDSVYVNVGESPAAGDISGSFTGGLTIGANTVALATDTTGNYVATITGDSQVTVSGSGSENAAISLSIAADSIGDTQLAFNTGQNLTSTSTPTFAGLTLNGSLTLANSETVSNGTDGTFTLGRNDAGTVTLTAADNDSTAAFTILPGGAAALTLGGASTTAVTITTDSTGDGEVVLPGNSVGNAELVNSGITFAGNTGSGSIALGGTLTVSGAGINNAVYSAGTVTITGTEADTLNTVAGRGASTATALTLSSTSNAITAGTLTINSDAFTDLTGTGLTISAGALQATLGTSIANSELDNDTVDFDKVSDTLTLDAATSITAGSALGLTIGNNVTLSATGTGAITATDLSCTDCIGATEITDLTLGTDTAGNYVATVTGGAGLTGSGSSEGSTPTLAVGAGNGITVNADDIAVNLTSSGTTGSTSSNSGLEVGSGGLSLLKGCADNELLKWTDVGGWACATDTSGSGSAAVQEGDSTIVASLSTLDFLGADFIVSESPAGEANVSIDYANSGIARVGQAETVTGGWTFNTAATTFTTAIDVNTASTIAGLTVDGNANFSVSNGSTDGALTLSGTTGDNALQITLTNGTTSGTQNIAYLDNAASTGTTESVLVIDNSDTDTAVTNGIEFVDAGGGFTNLFNVGGTLISSTEFTRLDGKDAALVDTNDAVATAITGTGTLTAGATGAGFTLNFGTSTLSGNVTGANISGVDISDDTNLTATDGITLTGDQLTLSSTTGGAGLTYTTGVLAVGAGTGISVAADSISATLGTDITNSELVNDTIDFDKISDTLTLDAATSITAGGALGLTIGNNVTLSATGTGAITATDLSCTDCIGATEISDLTLGTDTAGNYVATVTGGAGLTGSGSSEGSTPTLAVGAGTGITVNADDVAVNQDTAFAWTNGTTYTFTGTENLGISSDLAGTVNVISITGTPSGSAGTTSGLTVAQADSANTNGLDSALVITNSDTDLAVGAAIKLTSAGGGFTSVIDNAGTLISGTELNLLDGRDTALVDTTDAVATAITGTGTLTAGATGAGFTLNFGTSTLSGNVTGANISGVDISDDTNLTATDGITLTGDQLTLSSTTGGAGLTYTTGVLAVGAGTGISVAADSISATLGTDITNSELVNDTIDFDKVSDTLTLDAATSITAGSALGLTIGNNVTLSATGTGAITASDLSCTDCIGATEITDLTLGTDTAGNYVATVTGGAGLTGSGSSEGSTPTLAVGAGNGITVNADDIAVNLTSSGTTGSTSSNSGLEVGSGGLTLLKGCADNELLKWTDVGGWACATDTSGSGAATVQEGDATIVASLTTLDFLGADFIVSESPAGEANVSIDYANSGIARVGQAETVTGGWTFNTASTTFTTAIDVNTASTIAGLTVDGNANFSVSNGSIDGALSLSGTTADNALQITLTNGTSSGNQYVAYFDNAASTGTTDSVLVIDNSDTDTAVTNGIEFVDAGGGFTNLFNVGGTLISSTEFTRLDGKDAALVDTNDAVATAITGTGTLTAGATGAGFTINFGTSTLSGNVTGANISGVDISDDTNLTATDGITLTGDQLTLSSTTGGAGLTYTTGVLAVGAGTGISVAADSISATLGTDITNAELVDDTIDFDKITDASSLDADWSIALGTGEEITFNKSYTNNTSENGLVLNLTASDTGAATTAQYGLYVDNVASTEGADALIVLDNSDADDTVTAALRIIDAGGGFTTIIDNAGTLISGAELNRLDGKDAALVDTNDAVATAITGTGTLTAGATGAGFTINFGASTLSGNVTGANISGVDISDDTNLTATDGVTLTGDQLTLSSTTGGAGLTYTTGVLAVGAGTGISVAADSISATLGTDIANSEIVADTIDWDSISDTMTLDAATTITRTSNATNEDSLSISLVNSGGTAGTDRGFVISNAVSTNAAGDVTTEALLVLDQADTTASGTTAVTDGLLITNSGGSTFTNAITVGSGTQAIATALNIASTGVTTDISLQNGETIDNNSDGVINLTTTTFTLTGATTVTASSLATLTTGATLTVSGNLTVQGTTGLTLSGSGADLVFANSESITNDTNGQINFKRNDAGTVTLTAEDTDATAALTILPGGAAALTLGGASTTAITLTTDSTGDAEVVLPDGSISGTEILNDTVTLTTDTNGNYVASATANGGLTLTGTEAGSLGILLPAATDALSATTSSGSGLELLSQGVTLLQGCSTGEVLKWNEGSDVWACAADATGSSTAWDAISDPSGNGAIAMAATVQTLDWDTAGGTAALDAFTITFQNDITTDASVQRAFVVQNKDDAGANGTTESLIVADNADANEAVTNGLLITSSGAGGITTGINIDDTDVTTDISLQNGETIDNNVDGSLNLTATTLTLTNTTTLTASSLATLTTAATLTTSGNLTVQGTTGLTLTGVGGDLVFANSESITNDTNGQINFKRNDAGTVTLTAEDTDSTAALTILPGGAAALTLGGASTTAITLTTDSTGDAEVALPANSVGNAELVNSGITFAGDSGSSSTALGGTRTIAGGNGLTSAESGGTVTLTVGAGTGISVAADSISATLGTDIANSELVADTIDWDSISDTMTLDAATTITRTSNTTNEDSLSISLVNSGGTAGTDRAFVISNGVSTNAAGDVTTEALLVLDQADSTASGTTAVTDGLLITNSGGSTFTNAITVGSGTQAIATALNIASTGVTTDISLQNGETIDNNSDGVINLTATTLTLTNTTTITASSLATLTTAATLTASGNLTVQGTTGLTLSGVGGDLVFANSESITNDTNGQINFKRNDAGTVTLTAEDTDTTAALTILPGGAAALTLGGSSTTAITLTTDSTGDAEVVLPDGSISGTEILNDTVTLTTDTNGNYVSSATANGGLVLTGTEGGSLGVLLPAATDALSANTSSGSGLELVSAGLTLLQGCADTEVLKWNEGSDVWACGTAGGGGTWDTIGDAGGNGAIAFGSTVQTMDWGTMDANASYFTFNFTNAGTSAGTDNGVVINNAVTGSNTDTTTETLLLIQQLDTTAAGTTTVTSGLKIDDASAAPMTDAITINNTGASSAITNAINIADTTGTITTGLLMSGTFTNYIDTPNFDVSNAGVVTLAGAQTADITTQSNNALTLTPGGTGQLVLNSSNASASAIDLNATGTVAGAAITLDTTDGGITLTAAGASNGDITLAATDDIGINGTAGSVLSIGTSNVTQTVNIGLATNVDVSITDPNWSVTGAGTGSFADVVCASASCISTGEITANTIDFADISDTPTLDATTAIAFGASTFNLTFTNNGSGNEIHNLSSTGDLVIQDNGNNMVSFADTSVMTFFPSNATAANGQVVIDGAATDATLDSTTSGVFQLNIDVASSVVAGQGIYLDFQTTDDADATDTYNAMKIDFTNSTVDAADTTTALALNNANDASGGALDRLISLENNDANTAIGAGISFLAGGANSPDFTSGIDFSAGATFTDEITLSQGATINNTNDSDIFLSDNGVTLNIDFAESIAGYVSIVPFPGQGLAWGTDRDGASAMQFGTTAGGIDIYALAASAGEDINIGATGSSVNITSSEAAVDAIVLDAITNNAGVRIIAGDNEATTIADGNDIELKAEDDILGSLTAAGQFRIDAATNVDSSVTSATGGTLSLAVDAAPADASNYGFYIDYQTIDDANASDTFMAQRIDLTGSSVDNDVVYGLSINNANDASGAATDALLTLENNDANTAVNSGIAFLTGGANSPDFTYGLDFGSGASFSSDIRLQNLETIYNTSDGIIGFGTNSGGVTLELGGSAGGISNTSGNLTIDSASSTVFADSTLTFTGGTTITFEYNNGADVTTLLSNAGAGTAKLRIDSLTNGGSGCDTIDTSADGTLICGTDAGAGSGAANLKEAYDGDADGSDATILMTSTDGSIIFQTVAGTQFVVNEAAAPTVDMVSFDNTGTGTVTDGVDGLSITFVQATDTNAVDSNAALRITVTPGDETNNTIDAINIANVTAGTATERALVIGTGYDRDIEFADTAPVIRLADASTLTFDDGSGSGDLALGRLKEYFSTQNYGIFESGGFINIDGSFFMDNFSAGRLRGTADAATNRYGDGGAWAFDEAGTGGGSTATNSTRYGCNIQQNQLSGIGTYPSQGMMEISPETSTHTHTNADPGCILSMAAGTGTNTGGVLRATNKFVAYAKVKVSANFTQAASARQMFWGAHNYTEPWGQGWSSIAATHGFIGFSNLISTTTATNAAGGTQWNGFARSGANMSSVTCGTNGNISTATSNYALMRIEARATNDVRFFIDGDTSNGVSLSECGSGISSNIPTQALNPAFNVVQQENLSGATNQWTMFVDLFAFVQDDPRGGAAPSAPLSEIETAAVTPTTPDPIVGADIAENYLFDYGFEKINRGDIAVMTAPGKADVAAREYDRKILGVVSESPGLVLGDGNGNEKALPVALTGRVPVRVSAAGGEIRVGDPITSSTVPGVGIRATKPGKIVGTAMEDFSGSEEGKIMINVNVGYYLGDEGDTALLEQPTPLVLSESTIAEVFPQSTESGALVATESAEPIQNTQPGSQSLVSIISQALRFTSGLEVNGVFNNVGSAIFRGPVEFLAENVFRKSVTFEDTVTFNKDTAGKAVIHEGQRFVDVVFDKEYQNEPIVNASVSVPTVTEGTLVEYIARGTCIAGDSVDSCQDKVAGEILGIDIRFAVVSKSKQGFMILLNAPTPVELTFSWSAMSVKDAKTSSSAGAVSAPMSVPSPTPVVSPQPTSVPVTQAEPEVPTPEATAQPEESPPPIPQ